MGIEKLAVYAVRCGRTVQKKAVTSGKYLLKESKNKLLNDTKIGRRLKEGVHNARAAVKNELHVPDNTAGLVEEAEKRLQSNAAKAYKNLRNDKTFMEQFERFQSKREANQIVQSLDDLPEDKAIQVMIESMGIGSTKAAQIFGGNPKILEQMEQKYGKEFVQALKNTKSGCFPTRTLEEAQSAVNKAFKGQNIVVEKSMGVASIGETYLVRRSDGSKAVLKMIKKGVDKEQLELEEKLLSRMAKEFTDSPEELAKIRSQLKTLYSDWGKELNFATELKNNRLLANGAKRYKVAKITDIAEDGSCIIMDKANGIQMNKLVSMLKDYKENPADFAEKYAKEIAENPWLKDPEKVIKELPTSLMKAFDEQFMFLKKGGKTVMHGDPHTGNFFITTNEKGKLIPEFIDTGNCVTRTSKQVADDIKFFTNYFTGNSRSVAEYFVKQCPHDAAQTESLTVKVAEDIQKEIFGKVQNIKNFSDVQTVINTILKKNGLSISPENATATKAQMQFFSAISEASHIAGSSPNITTIMCDIPQASWCMLKSGTNPYYAVKDAMKFAYHNQKQAVGTAYQFAIKDIDKLINNGKINILG